MQLLQSCFHFARSPSVAAPSSRQAEKSGSVGWTEFIQVAELFVAGEEFPRGMGQVVCGHRFCYALGIIQHRLGHEVV